MVGTRPPPPVSYNGHKTEERAMYIGLGGLLILILVLWLLGVI
jgi:CHASE1-domain containing sensor protein